MKMIVRALLALLLVLGVALSLAACSSTPPPEIPEGFQVFEDGYLSFAFPNSWEKTGASTVILTPPEGKGNNVTVVYEEKTDLYENMTVDDFNKTVKPSFDAVDMAVTDVTVEQTTSNGQNVTKLNYSASLSDVSMEQTTFVITIRDRTYSVTVTEINQDDLLVRTVFDTLFPVH